MAIIQVSPKSSTNLVVVPACFKPDGKHAEQLMILAHELSSLTAMHKDYQRGFLINIHWKWWVKKFGKRYKEVQDAAIDAGLLRRNDSYCSDPQRAYTKSFSLTPQYRQTQYEIREISLCRTCTRQDELRDLDAVSRVMAAQFKRFSLPIDGLYPSFQYAASVLRVYAGFHYAGRDDFSARFHSSFCSLPKDARPSLSIDTGEQLALVDISCAQPFLLGSQASGRHNGLGSSSGTPSPSLTKWNSLTSRGELYKYLSNETGFNEDRIKGGLLKGIFNRNRANEKCEMWQSIKKVFPEVCAFAEGAKAKGHRKLAARLQRSESRLMIDGVAASLLDNEPDTPILTIHDAVICPARKVGIVADCIKRMAEKQTGQIPHLKIDYYKAY